MQTARQRCRARALIVALGAVLASGACRSPPPPIEQLVVSRMAIEEAVDAGAAEFAPGELAEARRQLVRAHEEAARKRVAQARLLAETAEVDARLATAKSRRAQAQRQLADAERGLKALGAPPAGAGGAGGSAR